ncbi:hypothetical protein [Bradyrhizobium cenepequi]
MSLVRTALRMAALNALKGATAGSGPTIAANRVYDSRVSDFSPETYPDDAKPTIIVLTDEDGGDALSAQNGGPPFRRIVQIVFEFAMVQGFDVPTDDGGTAFMPGYPATDGEHEASLDLLEYQILQRLAYDPDATCALFRQLGRSWKYDCHRQVLDDSGVKIAARVLTLTTEVSDDQVRVFIGDGVDDIPTGLDILPDPLKTVAKALPAGRARDICTALAASLTPLQAPELRGMDTTVANTAGQDPFDMFDVSVEIRSALDVPQVVATGASVVMDYAKGTFQQLILSANVTSISVTNWPATGKTGRLIIQVTNTGSFSATGWQNTDWAGGTEPTVTQGAGAKDLVVLTTGTHGTEIFGNVVGQNYS